MPKLPHFLETHGLVRRSWFFCLVGPARMLIVCAGILSASVLAFGQARISFIEKPRETQESVKLVFTITGASDRRVRVSLWGEVDHVVSREIALTGTGEHIVSVNLFEGRNRVSFIVYVNDEPWPLNDDQDSADIRCTGRWCKKPFTLPSEKVASEFKESGGPGRGQDEETQQSEEESKRRQEGTQRDQQGAGPDQARRTRQGQAEDQPQSQAERPAVDQENGEESKAITIEEPKQPEGKDFYLADNVSSIDSYVTVPKGIDEIQYDVLNDGKTVFTSSAQTVDTSADDAKVRVKLRFIRGLNTIRIYNAKKPGDGKQATIDIRCEGDNCPSDLNVATIVTNSQNTRIVVGMEQAGASSAESATKPFLDFFFTTPIAFTRQTQDEQDRKLPKVPRLALWGNVRLAATPGQITTTGIFPTNLVNQVGQSERFDLVQSFDFLAGLEGRAFTANGSFLSLIPTIRQKTRFYFAAGFGAISPLTVKKENAQIFKIPKPGDSQYDLFVDRYGTPPTGKEFVAFVPLDRDRFLRQWYAGIRLKTFYCENQDCQTFRNSFPAIVDFMVGQSESVTGGRTKYAITDPADKTKVLGYKKAYVFKVDAFYPMPFKEASFLYLYGTAIMKIGGGGVKINSPLFLDPGSILIFDPKVYVPPAQLQELLQPNRDYYKIGIGVNLTDLFNRNKTRQ